MSAVWADVPTTHTGLTLPDELTFEAWADIGERLATMERSVGWWLGDWWAFGETRYGQRKALLERLRAAGRDVPSYQTARDAGMVAGRFEPSRRRDNLTFKHHRETAPLPADQADAILDRAEAEQLSTREVRALVNQVRSAKAIDAPLATRDTCDVSDLEALVASGTTFGAIYADPPWLYDNQGTRAATGNHYDGLTVEQLCALPIRQLAARDAHLHLWTTNGFLFECPRIFEAWGFEFRSSFVWVKPQMGIGNYWRNSHEFLLTAIRGNAKRFNDHSLRSWLECDRSAHSSKPEQVRVAIERASPGPYLELFGRRSAERWTVFGNQIERGLFSPVMKEVA